MIYAVLVFLVVCEVVRNFLIIEILERTPNYAASVVLRLAAGVLLAWVFADQGPVKVFFMAGAVTFLLFDYGLNWARGKPFFYHGKKSRIDRIQRKYPVPAFFAKLWLAAVSIMILETTHRTSIDVLLYGW